MLPETQVDIHTQRQCAPQENPYQKHNHVKKLVLMILNQQIPIAPLITLMIIVPLKMAITCAGTSVQDPSVCVATLPSASGTPSSTAAYLQENIAGLEMGQQNVPMAQYCVNLNPAMEAALRIVLLSKLMVKMIILPVSLLICVTIEGFSCAVTFAQAGTITMTDSTACVIMTP